MDLAGWVFGGSAQRWRELDGGSAGEQGEEPASLKGCGPQSLRQGQPWLPTRRVLLTGPCVVTWGRAGAAVGPILQMRKQRPREIVLPALRHHVAKRQSPASLWPFSS